MRLLHRNPLAPLLFICLASVAWAQVPQWSNFEQSVEIRADGSVVIEDVRTVDATAAAGEAFLCVEHGSDVGFSMLSDTGSIDPGGGARTVTQTCRSGAPGTEIVITPEDPVEEWRVKFHYRLDGSLQVHEDVVHWYWTLYGRDEPSAFPPSSITVTTPPLYSRDVFLYRYATNEPLAIEPAGTSFVLEPGYVSSGDGIVIRMLMDPDGFTVKGTGRARDQYLDEVKRLTAPYPAGGPVFVAYPAGVTESGELSFGHRLRPNSPPVERGGLTARVRGGEELDLDCMGIDRFEGQCTAPLPEEGAEVIDIRQYGADGRVGVVSLRRTASGEYIFDRVPGDASPDQAPTSEANTAAAQSGERRGPRGARSSGARTVDATAVVLSISSSPRAPIYAATGDGSEQKLVGLGEATITAEEGAEVRYSIRPRAGSGYQRHDDTVILRQGMSALHVQVEEAPHDADATANAAESEASTPSTGSAPAPAPEASPTPETRAPEPSAYGADTPERAVAEWFAAYAREDFEAMAEMSLPSQDPDVAYSWLEGTYFFRDFVSLDRLQVESNNGVSARVNVDWTHGGGRSTVRLVVIRENRNGDPSPGAPWSISYTSATGVRDLN